MNTIANTSSNTQSQEGPRIPVKIDKDTGLMVAGEAKRPIDINNDVSLALSSYLSMVYELRSMTSGVVSLRVEDISSLAEAFEMEETDIGERLARLMHCDDLQTRRFLQMLKRGRVLVPISMVAAGALIAVTLSFSGPSAPSITPTSSLNQTRASVEVVAPTTIVRTEAVVDIGDAAVIEKAPTFAQDSAPAPTPVTVAPDENLNDTPDFAGPPSEPDIQIGEGISVTRGDGQGE